jgi:hypothetical protein
MSEPLLHPTLPKKMTHADCVAAAVRYCKGYKVVLPEFYTHHEEIPDVLAFTNGGIRNNLYSNGVFSVLIECKMSRGDFLADKNKRFRISPEKGMGDCRYYCCPKGLIGKEEVPDGWGLIYIYPSGVVRQVKDSRLHERDINAELYVLYYYARRANFAGVHPAILDYRGFDS